MRTSLVLPKFRLSKYVIVVIAIVAAQHLHGNPPMPPPLLLSPKLQLLVVVVVCLVCYLPEHKTLLLVSKPSPCRTDCCLRPPLHHLDPISFLLILQVFIWIGLKTWIKKRERTRQRKNQETMMIAQVVSSRVTDQNSFGSQIATGHAEAYDLC